VARSRRSYGSFLALGVGLIALILFAREGLRTERAIGAAATPASADADADSRVSPRPEHLDLRPSPLSGPGSPVVDAAAAMSGPRVDEGPVAEVPGGPRRADSLPPELPRIRGRVEFEGGLPEGVALRVATQSASPDSSRADSGLAFDATVAPDGGFGISLGKGPRHAIEVTWSDGHVVVEVRVATGDRRDVSIRVGTARLEGRILDAEGRPIVDASVRADPFEGLGERMAGRHAVSDADGAWVLDHMPAGKHWIQAFMPRRPAGGGEVRRETVSLAPGERRVLELGVAAADVRFLGRLRLRNGTPMPGPGRVHLVTETSSREAGYDAAGRFAIAAPPGAYRLGVSPRGPGREFVFELPQGIRPDATPPPAPDAVVLRTDLEADVTLVGGSVSGRLLEFGRPD
jgi:hypothetical protein